MSIALRHKQHSETLVHAHSISFLDTFCTPEPLWTRAFPQAHKEHAETPMSTGLPLNFHTIYSNATSELERFAPQWTEQTHSDWPVLHELMRPAHLKGYEGVKKQEIWRGTDREKVETDVWGDSYSKISWDLFAGILFWLVVVHGEVFSTQPLW